ncbi:zf-HC2 domain-containing protein [candidate division KSB1 bacterium]|nr:zf-HC2 domain-containing protein [candidate division KSB1 bacterium]
MNCETVYSHVEDYFDSNVSPEQMRAISDHLDSCAPCRNRLMAEERFRAALRKSLLKPQPTDDAVWHRALESLPSQRLPSRSTSIRRQFLLAAAVAVLAVGGLLYQKFMRASSLLDLITADYHEYVRGEMDLSLQSSEFAEVSRFFESQLGVRIDQCSAPDERCRLVGGRTCYLNHVPTALLVFHQESEPVSVFVLPTSELHRFPRSSLIREGAFWKGTASGLAVCGRPVGDQLVCAVGDTNPESLEQLLESICVN